MCSSIHSHLDGGCELNLPLGRPGSIECLHCRLRLGHGNPVSSTVTVSHNTAAVARVLDCTRTGSGLGAGAGATVQSALKAEAWLGDAASFRLRKRSLQTTCANFGRTGVVRWATRTVVQLSPTPAPASLRSPKRRHRRTAHRAVSSILKLTPLHPSRAQVQRSLAVSILASVASSPC
jgi:hypothetical protein